MKIIFIDNESIPNQKIAGLVSDTDPAFTDKTKKIYLYNSSNGVDEILKQLDIGEDIINDIKCKCKEDELVVLINNYGKASPYSTSQNFKLPAELPDTLEFETIRVACTTEEVFVNNKLIRLTAFEYKLLLFFIANQKKIIPRKIILDYLWGNNRPQFEDIDNSMYTHIKNLKKKLTNAGSRNFIHSVYGKGYRFNDL
jgi:hypothetical protein